MWTQDHQRENQLKNEIKEEKDRLKQKNEFLKVAHKKKRMMVETTYKLQRLNIDQDYLKNWFTTFLQYLSDSKYWGQFRKPAQIRLHRALVGRDP
jgi:hypothetical protein